MKRASLSRRLIRFCEDITSNSEYNDQNDYGFSSQEDSGFGNMDDPMDMPLPTETDIEVTDNEDGATVTVATPKGTSVTVSERLNRIRQRRLRENSRRNKSRRPFWMNEEEETETPDDFMEESPSGKDGRHVTGTVSDDNGTDYDIDGTLAFSGNDLEIEDIDLDSVSTGNADFEEDTEETSEEESGDALEKKEDDEIIIDESKSLISKDPISDMLQLRSSNHEKPIMSGKPRKEPVRRVHSNSLNNRRELDIKKPQQGVSDLKDSRWQTKEETD